MITASPCSEITAFFRFETSLARRDGSEVPVGKIVVPKTGQKPPSPREDASEAPVGKVAVPKTGQKPPFATRGCP